MLPTMIIRPCGLVVCVWPTGQLTVLSAREAEALRESLEACFMAADCREAA